MGVSSRGLTGSGLRFSFESSAVKRGSSVEQGAKKQTDPEGNCSSWKQAGVALETGWGRKWQPLSVLPESPHGQKARQAPVQRSQKSGHSPGWRRKQQQRERR